MNTIPNPGLRSQAGARTFFRVAGCVLLPLGVVVFGWGIMRMFEYDGYDSPPGLYIAAFMGGLPIIGLGLMCLNVGFLGAAARYGAGETMPVLKDSAAYLSDGRGVMGVGRTAAEPVSTATGPFCRSCGVRNDPDATFCDGCGQRLS